MSTSNQKKKAAPPTHPWGNPNAPRGVQHNTVGHSNAPPPAAPPGLSSPGGHFGRGKGPSNYQQQHQVVDSGEVKNKDSIRAFVNGLNKNRRDHYRMKFLNFIQDILGTEVDAFLVDGRVFRGILHATSPYEGKHHEVALKAVRPMKDNVVLEDKDVELGSTLILNYDYLVKIVIAKDKINKNIRDTQNLMTDTAIQKSNKVKDIGENRSLENISSSWLSQDTELGNDKSIGNWNQFEANQKLYNVKSTYDENIYTKKLDLSTLSQEQLKHADKIAREIENARSTNIHLQEERGHLQQQEFDEEFLYSEVTRTPAHTQEQPKIQTADKTENVWRRGLTQQGSASPQGKSPREKKSTNSKNPNSPSSKSKPVTNAQTPPVAVSTESNNELKPQELEVQRNDSSSNTSLPDTAESVQQETETVSHETSNPEEPKQQVDASPAKEVASTDDKSSTAENKTDSLNETNVESTTSADSTTSTTSTSAAGSDDKPKKKLNASAAEFVPGKFSAPKPPAQEFPPRQNRQFPPQQFGVYNPPQPGFEYVPVIPTEVVYGMPMPPYNAGFNEVFVPPPVYYYPDPQQSQFVPYGAGYGVPPVHGAQYQQTNPNSFNHHRSHK